MTASRVSGIGAILLVGGRSRRMGGGIKPLLEVGGSTLFARSMDALTDAGCEAITAVGPVLDAAMPVRWVREDPPFAGPVAGIAAALAGNGALPDGAPPEPEWTLLLAGDLPRVESLVARLVAAAASASEVDAHAFTADGHPQWLAGIYRTIALRAALAAFTGEYAGASCRALLGDLAISWIPDEDGVTADIDTPADLARIRAELEEKP
ncbi:molybdenum cofactor guanylyltransferase [Microbacterium sp. A196]|uniref:molybdenum cofactor guanylyltransferase n=1 Tax=unclassified Microbacterium TaxID=2609290 RepID=UPI003FD0C651